MTVRFDPEKFRELILYVSERSKNDPRFGLTKLNKILYFSDFKAYGILGQSITGATHIRLDRSPAPREMLEMLDQMERDGDIDRVERSYFNYTQQVVMPKRAANVLELISHDELQLVDAVLDELRLLNASEVSALSHLERGWQLAQDREVIPYEMVFLSDRPLSPRERSQWKQAVDDWRAERASASR